MKIIEKNAFFKDKNDNEQIAFIRINEGIYIGIKTQDSKKNPTGYMSLYFHPDKRLFLDTVYCYDQFRGSGIATKISELADYLLKDYPSYVIRGVYEPKQLSTDREKNIERSEDELDKAARKFYEKAGYQIIEYEDYTNHPEKYSFLTEYDFNLGEGGPRTIVTKQLIQKDHPFYEEDEIIYYREDEKLSGKRK